MATTAPRPRTGTPARVAMAIVAGLSLIATLGAGALSTMGLMLIFDEQRGDVWLWALIAVLIGVPLVALATAIVAMVATITGRRGWTWAAIPMFALVAIASGMFVAWLGAISY